MPKAGDFDEQLVGYHFWSSIGLTGFILLTYLSHEGFIPSLKKLYKPFLYLTMLLLLLTGHFGGALTHGTDHLTKPLGNYDKASVSDVNTLNAYDDIVLPILKQKCYSCHNAGKKKGDFMMSSQEGLLKGGKAGQSIVAGKPKESSLIGRIHLPLEDDEHMPPKGKKQLSKQEVRLLEWWIETGPSFDKLVGELTQSEEISQILKTYESSDAEPDDNGLDPLSIEGQSELNRIGINISGLNESSPFFRASLSRDTIINNQKLDRLKRYAEYVTDLDLSFSNFDDDMMRELSAFKNLSSLKLQQTAISEKGLKHIKELKYLRSLNLYNNDISDEVFDYLGELKALRQLYLWQTNVSKESVQAFSDQHPLISISHEIEDEIFGDAQLKPPLISADQDIFEDTLLVTLSLNFSKVNVFYTLDGSVPDTNSIKYDKPFSIDQTSNIKAISHKEGWVTSEINEAVYTKVGHKISLAKLEKQPSDKYKAKGAASLIDFVKGTESFVDGNWLGYEGEHMMVTMDLGSVKSVNNVVVGALEATASYIFYPKGIEVSTSVNGKTFEKMKRIDIPIAKGPHPNELKSYLLDLESHDARYVIVKVLGTLKNPEWHAAPGAKNWIFIDEIMVN